MSHAFFHCNFTNVICVLPSIWCTNQHTHSAKKKEKRHIANIHMRQWHVCGKELTMKKRETNDVDVRALRRAIVYMTRVQQRHHYMRLKFSFILLSFILIRSFWLIDCTWLATKSPNRMRNHFFFFFRFILCFIISFWMWSLRFNILQTNWMAYAQFHWSCQAEWKRKWTKLFGDKRRKKNCKYVPKPIWSFFIWRTFISFNKLTAHVHQSIFTVQKKMRMQNYTQRGNSNEWAITNQNEICRRRENTIEK